MVIGTVAASRCREIFFVESAPRKPLEIVVQQPARKLLQKSEQRSTNSRVVARQAVWTTGLSKPPQVIIARIPFLERERDA